MCEEQVCKLECGHLLVLVMQNQPSCFRLHIEAAAAVATLSLVTSSKAAWQQRRAALPPAALHLCCFSTQYSPGNARDCETALQRYWLAAA
jgi:hypothetical protein